MEHLALEIFDLTGTGSKYAVLPEDASVTITDTSDIFATGDVWSHPFTLNVRANAHIFGSAGDMHGARLHDQLDRRRARLWVEGLPLYLGYLRLGDEAEVDADGNVDVTIESGQKTFDEMIEGAKCNQVPLMSDVQFGMALWRKRKTKVKLKLKAAILFDDGSTSGAEYVKDAGGSEDFEFQGEGETDAVQDYPRMVFPKGDFYNMLTHQRESGLNFLNVQEPYDEDDKGTPVHPYCNVALCYQRQGYTKKMQDGQEVEDYSAEPEAQRGYESMPADRVNSAPNFFVIYWLRCLMKHLGIHVDENQMLGVEDLRRLFFVNTNCAYRKTEKLRTAVTDPDLGKYEYAVAGQRLVAEHMTAMYKIVDIEDFKPVIGFDGWKQVVNLEECGFTATGCSYRQSGLHDPTTPKGLIVEVNHLNLLDNDEYSWYEDANDLYHKAIATSECFPDVDISEAVKALEDGFGIRLLFSDDYKRVRIVLLRNVFRDTTVQTLACDVVSESKVENSIRGFRMTYGGGSDDTHFYYKGFADMLPHSKTLWPDNSDTHDYSQWKLDAVYGDIINRVSAFDKTCFVTPVNGNAYGIKVDKDAKRYDELHPSLFEYAPFMDAEDGDCTGEEETIQTVTVGFKPAIMNDLNMEAERKASSDEDRKQRFALFVDETMRPRRPDLMDLESGKSYNDPDIVYFVDKAPDGSNRKFLYGDDSPAKGMAADDGVIKPGEFAIASDMFAQKKNLRLSTLHIWGSLFATTGWDVSFDIDGHVNEGYRLYLQDNFEPNDDGVSPIETHDWGLTLGIMRGSGDDAGVEYGPDPDDWEGNDTWEVKDGTSVTSHPDTCNNYGQRWDYNGTGQGVGTEEGRFSLKLRAEKPNPHFDPTREENTTDNRRYLEIDTPELRGRGLMDQFYKEYSYWVRNARIARREVRIGLGQLLSIDKTKRVTVGDITGFIRKTQYQVTNKKGLGNVTMEIMYI